MLATRMRMAGAGPNLEYIGTTVDNTVQTVFTFTDHAIGAATNAREVVVAITANNSSNARTLSSVTIGGITATIHVSGAYDPGEHPRVHLVSAPVPTGTTGTIVVTYSGNMGDCAVNVYRMTGHRSATPFGTVTDTSFLGAPSGNLNIPDKGCALAGMVNINAATAITWAGLTEDYDADSTDGERFSAAHDQHMHKDSALTVSATGGSASALIAAASWV